MIDLSLLECDHDRNGWLAPTCDKRAGEWIINQVPSVFQPFLGKSTKQNFPVGAMMSWWTLHIIGFDL